MNEREATVGPSTCGESSFSTFKQERSPQSLFANGGLAKIALTDSARYHQKHLTPNDDLSAF